MLQEIRRTVLRISCLKTWSFKFDSIWVHFLSSSVQFITISNSFKAVQSLRVLISFSFSFVQKHSNENILFSSYLSLSILSLYSLSLFSLFFPFRFFLIYFLYFLVCKIKLQIFFILLTRHLLFPILIRHRRHEKRGKWIAMKMKNANKTSTDIFWHKISQKIEKVIKYFLFISASKRQFHSQILKKLFCVLNFFCFHSLI